jgi:Lar family restriction alleviation protein
MIVKPCPFCDDRNVAPCVRNDSYRYYFCGSCGAQGPFAFYDTVALKKWNTRLGLRRQKVSDAPGPALAEGRPSRQRRHKRQSRTVEFDPDE